MDPALESIEASILPSTVMLLDGLLDAAVLALPGIDSAAYAADLKALARQVEDLTARVAALAPAQEPERLRMSA
jgi:hypothetical protein